MASIIQPTTPAELRTESFLAGKTTGDRFTLGDGCDWSSEDSATGQTPMFTRHVMGNMIWLVKLACLKFYD